jgi:hypothetical protein
VTRIAYLDESLRPGGFVLAAVAVEHGRVESIRREIRAAAPLGGGRRRHFSKESDGERKRLLDAYRVLPGSAVSAVAVKGCGRPVDHRASALELLVSHLIEDGLSRLILDHVDEKQRRRDRQVLSAALRGHVISYSHEPAHSREPMLWVPDAVAWCLGRAAWRLHVTTWARVIQV